MCVVAFIVVSGRAFIVRICWFVYTYICELPPTQLPNMLLFICTNRFFIQSLPKKVITATFATLVPSGWPGNCAMLEIPGILMSHKITYCI